MRSRRRRNLIVLLSSAFALALAAGPLTGGASSQTSDTSDPKNPLAGDGMWIWYLSRSSHGNLNAIAARAHARGIETVLIKSGDGTRYWGQFSSSVVSGAAGVFEAASPFSSMASIAAASSVGGVIFLAGREAIGAGVSTPPVAPSLASLRTAACSCLRALMT